MDQTNRPFWPLLCWFPHNRWFCFYWKTLEWAPKNLRVRKLLGVGNDDVNIYAFHWFIPFYFPSNSPIYVFPLNFLILNTQQIFLLIFTVKWFSHFSLLLFFHFYFKCTLCFYSVRRSSLSIETNNKFHILYFFIIAVELFSLLAQKKRNVHAMCENHSQ